MIKHECSTCPKQGDCDLEAIVKASEAAMAEGGVPSLVKEVLKHIATPSEFYRSLSMSALLVVNDLGALRDFRLEFSRYSPDLPPAVQKALPLLFQELYSDIRSTLAKDLLSRLAATEIALGVEPEKLGGSPKGYTPLVAVEPESHKNPKVLH